MTKSELIQRLAERNPHLYMRDVEKIVDTVFEEITAALVTGNRVELRGFGAFSVKEREARMGRNPRTGESVFVEAKRLPFFKTGKALRERLNDETGSAQSTDDSADAPAYESEIAPSGTFGSGQTGGNDDDNRGGGGGFGGGNFY